MGGFPPKSLRRKDGGDEDYLACAAFLRVRGFVCCLFLRMTDTLQNTPLLNLHRKRGGRLSAFAGWQLPVFYDGGGVMNEHLQTRTAASMFDVSHMAQLGVSGDALAQLSTTDPSALAVGECKYAALLQNDGGIVDDFIVGNDGEDGNGDYFCVFNASRKMQVLAHLQTANAVVREYNDWALLAVQGPAACAEVARVFPAAAQLAFMHSAKMQWRGLECRICRCGYTGEDGFEISAPAANAEALAEELLSGGAVLPAGLGARDSLRLEAGLCLYGSELNEQTTPAEAGLLWIIGKARLQNGSFAGADILRTQKQNGTTRKLAGLLPQSKIPVRGGAKLMRGDDEVGEVSSGLYSPTLAAPVAMGYIKKECCDGGDVDAIVRGKRVVCQITGLPFVPHRYKK